MKSLEIGTDIAFLKLLLINIMKKPNSKKFNIIRIIKISCILLMFQNTANAELIFRGGYLTKMLPTSEGYNQFLKERYGASSIQLSGTTISTGFKSKASSWGIGFGMDDLSGNINYKTLNGDKKQNKMNLKNTHLLISIYPQKWQNFQIDVGYGSGELSRNFYGYKDYHIVTGNIASQVGAQESKTKASNMMVQVLYRFFGQKFRLEGGARYSNSKHTIPEDDLRPGYNSKGVPIPMTFDLGGLGFTGTISFRF